MPTYEYECKSCSHRFEAFQTMSAKHIKSCPECGKAVRRLIGAGAGFIMKGASAPPCREACGMDTPCCAKGESCGM
jgi:putative FmdB family regulatory protein